MVRHKSRATDYARCQIEIFSNISNKNLDRKEYQRKNRIQRKITEKITKQHEKLN